MENISDIDKFMLLLYNYAMVSELSRFRKNNKDEATNFFFETIEKSLPASYVVLCEYDPANASQTVANMEGDLLLIKDNSEKFKKNLLDVDELKIATIGVLKNEFDALYVAHSYDVFDMRKIKWTQKNLECVLKTFKEVPEETKDLVASITIFKMEKEQLIEFIEYLYENLAEIRNYALMKIYMGEEPDEKVMKELQPSTLSVFHQKGRDGKFVAQPKNPIIRGFINKYNPDQLGDDDNH